MKLNQLIQPIMFIVESTYLTETILTLYAAESSVQQDLEWDVLL